jgi:hypothetical protein
MRPHYVPLFHVLFIPYPYCSPTSSMNHHIHSIHFIPAMTYQSFPPLCNPHCSCYRNDSLICRVTCHLSRATLLVYRVAYLCRVILQSLISGNPLPYSTSASVVSDKLRAFLSRSETPSIRSPPTQIDPPDRHITRRSSRVQQEFAWASLTETTALAIRLLEGYLPEADL